MRAVLAATAAALASACTLEEGPLMAPGQDCIECHDGGEAKRWTVAGTWTRGAHVDVTDANGKTVPMRGNKVGNFYTAEPLTPPLTIRVDGVEMATTALQSSSWPSGSMAYGGCNLCHGSAQLAGDWAVRAEQMAPGRDCLRCHDGGRAVRFTVAGTWNANQGDVVVVDSAGKRVTMRPNAVGNFYTTEALALPLQTVEVGGSRMEDEMPLGYGGCNACHGRGKPED